MGKDSKPVAQRVRITVALVKDSDDIARKTRSFHGVDLPLAEVVYLIEKALLDKGYRVWTAQPSTARRTARTPRF
jgi:hypothetical protein